MMLRQRLHSYYKRLEAFSNKYLLPQEFYAVLLFFVIGIAALFYRGGKSLLETLFPSDEHTRYALIAKETDSIFNMLSKDSVPLHFWDSAAPDASETSKKEAGKSEVVDLSPASIVLNKASSTDLEKLPGVGEVMSKRIISYRTARGKFSTLEELMNVSGIGQKKFEKMKPFLRLD